MPWSWVRIPYLFEGIDQLSGRARKKTHLKHKIGHSKNKQKTTTNCQKKYQSEKKLKKSLKKYHFFYYLVYLYKN